MDKVFVSISLIFICIFKEVNNLRKIFQFSILEIPILDFFTLDLKVESSDLPHFFRENDKGYS